MKGFIFFVYTYSPLHAGTGQDIGKADLPIQREKHTNYPCVYASSLKGALKDFFTREKNNGNKILEQDEINKIFGKEEQNSPVGSMIFTDLKLLFFPVRSSEGTFKWVITDKVINRFKRDYKIVKNKESFTLDVLQRLLPESVENIENKLILEDFIFGNPPKKADCSIFKIIDLNCSNAFILEDKYYDYLVENSTQIIARNELDETKTSKNLWYEEVLPADTILYSLVLSMGRDGDEYIEKFSKELKDRIIQIGGNETIGYGISKIILLED